MPNETDEPKKTLTRDEILNAETPSKVHDLPSGQVVTVKYLAVFMVREIRKSSESTTEGNIERIFTEKVIKWMLRENDQKDLDSFSEEDQQQLIKIAVEEWGCEDEYEQFRDIENPEVRFYQAVKQQERELAKQLSESVRAITTNLGSAMAPMKNVQMELSSSMKGMLDAHFGESAQVKRRMPHSA